MFSPNIELGNRVLEIIGLVVLTIGRYKTQCYNNTIIVGHKIFRYPRRHFIR